MDELLVEIKKAETEARELSPGQLALYLRTLLGGKLLAYCCALVDAEQAETLADSDKDVALNDEQTGRLRALYEAAKIVAEIEGPSSARAWLVGRDPFLDDDAAAKRLHDGEYDAVVAAAQNFVYGG